MLTTTEMPKLPPVISEFNLFSPFTSDFRYSQWYTFPKNHMANFHSSGGPSSNITWPIKVYYIDFICNVLYFWNIIFVILKPSVYSLLANEYKGLFRQYKTSHGTEQKIFRQRMRSIIVFICPRKSFCSTDKFCKLKMIRLLSVVFCFPSEN